MKTTISIRTISSILFTLFCLETFAQSSTVSKIEKAYQTFENSTALKNGTASFMVLDGNTGKPIFQKNEEIGLATASTLKVITAASAFDILGQDFTFKTQLFYTGDIQENGVLDGDIIISGSGDPTLGSHRFPETNAEQIINKWLYAIQGAGIKEINGRVIGDEQLYKGYKVPGGWIWSDIGNYYGAGISALNWKENALGINFSPDSQVGKPAQIKNLTHNIDQVQIINEVNTGNIGTGDRVYAYSSPYASKIYIRGSYGLDLKKTIEISRTNPAYDVAHELTISLNLAGIKTSHAAINRLEKNNSNEQAHLLDVHESPKLAAIVYWFNQKSINLYGEALLKAIAYQTSQKTETNEGAELIQKYWENKLDIQASALNNQDGSGLSPQNRVTTAAMSNIMQYAQAQSWYPEFYKSLPEYNKMKMKSGTIGGALGYTGIHSNTLGEKFTFTLIVNNYAGSASSMRKNMFNLLDALK